MTHANGDLVSRRRRFSVVHTGGSHLPYEVIDSERYGDVMGACRTRAVAILLAKGLNETRPSRRRRAANSGSSVTND